MRYWLIDNNGFLQNTINWDGATALPIPTGWSLQQASGQAPPLPPAAVTVQSQQTNSVNYQQQCLNAITNLTAAFNNWATLTANQKDQAAQLCTIVCARLIQLALNQLN